MKQTELVGKAQTILGPVDAESLGITLYHEHLLFDMSPLAVPPCDASEKELANQPISLENLHWVRTHRMLSRDNLAVTDEEIAIEEALEYKQAGGKTIVEVSSTGMKRNPQGLAQISRATGLHIIMGAGYYLDVAHPPEVDQRTENDIAQEIVRDILEGVGDTGIHAGVIGEIGCSLPLVENERKVLRAGAIAQRITGAPLVIHPSPDDDVVLEIIDILSNAGADLRHTVISHVDLMGFTPTTRQKIMDAGCFLGYDCFGHLGYPHMMYGRVAQIKGDLEKVNDVVELIENGHLDRILISQDNCFKDCLTAFGGYGYAHILRNVVPLMLMGGVTEEQVHMLMVENPKRMFEFTPAQE